MSGLEPLPHIGELSRSLVKMQVVGFFCAFFQTAGNAGTCAGAAIGQILRKKCGRRNENTQKMSEKQTGQFGKMADIGP